MVNHDIVRLNISVHDAFAVAEVEGLASSASRRTQSLVTHLQQLENVVAHVVILKLGVKASKVGIVDVFEDK